MLSVCCLTNFVIQDFQSSLRRRPGPFHQPPTFKKTSRSPPRRRHFTVPLSALFQEGVFQVFTLKYEKVKQTTRQGSTGQQRHAITNPAVSTSTSEQPLQPSPPSSRNSHTVVRPAARCGVSSGAEMVNQPQQTPAKPPSAATRTRTLGLGLERNPQASSRPEAASLPPLARAADSPSRYPHSPPRRAHARRPPPPPPMRTSSTAARRAPSESFPSALLFSPRMPRRWWW